jgi:hypothetical protein
MKIFRHKVTKQQYTSLVLFYLPACVGFVFVPLAIFLNSKILLQFGWGLMSLLYIVYGLYVLKVQKWSLLKYGLNHYGGGIWTTLWGVFFVLIGLSNLWVVISSI